MSAGNVTFGKASAWCCRWLDLGRRDCYTVTVWVDGGLYCDAFSAVVDDFGNLVRVPR